MGKKGKSPLLRWQHCCVSRTHISICFRLKKHLAGQIFHGDEEVKNVRGCVPRRPSSVRLEYQTLYTG
jgi:hypothetical protein